MKITSDERFPSVVGARPSGRQAELPGVVQSCVSLGVGREAGTRALELLDVHLDAGCLSPHAGEIQERHGIGGRIARKGS